MRTPVILFLLSGLLLAACDTGGGSGGASVERRAPPGAGDFVGGPYAPLGRPLASLDARRLGCPSCSPVPRILAAADLSGNGNSELILTFESFDGAGRAIQVPTRMSIVTTGGAPYRGVDRLPRRVHAREAAVADFNGDGVDDIFVAGSGADGPRIFPGEQNALLLSRGRGRHIDASLSHLPRQDDFAHGVATSDLDRDGDTDIFVMTHRGTAGIAPYVLLNDGSGRFEKAAASGFVPRILTRLNYDYNTVRFADLNRDGLPDLLAAQNEAASSLVFYGRSGGGFGGATRLPNGQFGASTRTTDIDVADLDRDGRPDLILTNTGDADGAIYRGLEIQILMNEGGRFVDRTASRIWGQDWPAQGDVNIPHNITLADLNGDRAPDLVVQSLNPVWGTRPGDVPAQIGLNDGRGRFRPVRPTWLDPGNGFRARQLLPVRSGGRWRIAGQDLLGTNAASGFRPWGQRVILY